MSPRGALIMCSCPTGKLVVQGSGILFDGGAILTSGALFLPYVKWAHSRKLLRLILDNASSDMADGANLCDIFAFGVCMPSESGEVDCRGHEADILGIWQCPYVFGSLGSVLEDWSFGENFAVNNCLPRDLDTPGDLVRALLSVFIILRLRAAGSARVCDRAVVEGILEALAKPARGQCVTVESTPFGNHVFFNSLSRGIICNIVGRQSCLFLTDATTMSGCEGGPVYSEPNYGSEKNGKRHLLGMINASMIWCRGEYVGLALGVSLLPVLRRIVLPLRKFNNPVHISNQLKDRNLLDETILLVHCGSSWGTGLVVDAASGCVLTCSHVLKAHSTNKITVFHNGNKYSGDLVFRTRDNLAYDIAVVKISTPNAFSVEMEMDKTPAQVGEPVIAAGFPFFNENTDIGLRPTIVQGCISKVSPVMFQTTCCIQYGASGGAIIRNGKILGMAVCNLKNSRTMILFPHINFSIPASVFAAPIENYIKTGSILHLKSLESSDPAVQRLWRLKACKL